MQLAAHLDTGNALDVSGIQDEFVLNHLHTLLSNLPVIRRTNEGHYFSKNKDSPSVASFMDRLIRAATSNVAATNSNPLPVDSKREQRKVYYDGDATIAARGHAGSTQVVREVVVKHHHVDDVGEENCGTTNRRRISHGEGASRVIGPTMPPPGKLAEMQEVAMERERFDGQRGCNEDKRAPALNKRIVGPELPPQRCVDSEGDATTCETDRGGMARDDGDFVGPLPVDGLGRNQEEEISLDERTREMQRVMGILQDHEAAQMNLRMMDGQALGKSGRRDPPDPYKIMQLAPTASSSEIKKRYMLLSLKVHPDKCSHPDAPKVFQAVSAAAKELKDPEARAAADKRIEEARLRHRFAAMQAQQQRAREWEAVREGKQSISSASGVSFPKRDAWMTEVPLDRTRRGKGTGSSFNT